MKKFEDPNQILIPFPEENTAEENIPNKAEEVPLKVGFAPRTQEEKDDDNIGIYKAYEHKNNKKDKEWLEKEKNRIFDQGAMSAMRIIIGSFKDIIVIDIAFNANFSEKSDANDFEKIKNKAQEHSRRGDSVTANNLNRGMGVLRRISKIKKMLDNLEHQKLIDYIDDLKNTNKNTCNVIVQSKQYDELMTIINNYRKK